MTHALVTNKDITCFKRRMEFFIRLLFGLHLAYILYNTMFHRN